MVGEVNVVWAIDAILPQKLNTPYHILIITNDQARTKEKCERLSGNIIAGIKTLRDYDIKVEIVFADTIHKRKIFLNYLSVTCDKGFAMFRVNDEKTVRDDNDFRYEKLFHRIYPNEGNSVLKSDLLLLKQLQNKCKTVKDFVNNAGPGLNRRILGDCRADKSITNRLINDV